VSGTILIEPALETTDDLQPVDMWRGDAITEMHSRGRGIQQLVESTVWWIRREPRRATRREQDDAQ
jgi:hypothetical protein